MGHREPVREGVDLEPGSTQPPDELGDVGTRAQRPHPDDRADRPALHVTRLHDHERGGRTQAAHHRAERAARHHQHAGPAVPDGNPEIRHQFVEERGAATGCGAHHRRVAGGGHGAHVGIPWKQLLQSTIIVD